MENNEFQGVKDHELLYFIADKQKDPATARRAWDEFYARRFAGLERACLRFVEARMQYASAFVRSVMTTPGDAAHDLATDVMLKVWDGMAADFTEEPAEGTSSIAVAYWLAKAAGYLFANAFRSAMRKEARAARNARQAVDEDTPGDPVQFNEDGTFDAQSREPTAEELLYKAQVHDIVHQALERLSPRDRLVLRTAVECDVAIGSGGRGDAEAAGEMARRLDMPVGSARQAKNRALKSLREKAATRTETKRTHEEMGTDADQSRSVQDRSAAD